MNSINTALCIAVVCATSLGAQTSQTETKSTTTVKGGATVTLTGCIARATGSDGYMLTNVADKKGPGHNYWLVSKDDVLSAEVGHLVRVRGKVTDQGDAKIKMETETKTKVEHGDDKTVVSKAEIKGNTLPGLPLLNVTSVKLIAAACP